MNVPATILLENIIREELALILEDNGPSDLEKYSGKSLPEPTSGSIQKFLGIPVHGRFDDKTAKAVADFIYGPKTGHGLDTVEELYDRMKSDGWDVGAKTGTIFANNGKMANSILKLMAMRTMFTGAGKVGRISTRYLYHSAYRNHPNINKVKYGLDYGGKDKWSTPKYDEDFKDVPIVKARPASEDPMWLTPSRLIREPDAWKSISINDEGGTELLLSIGKYNQASKNADITLDILNDYLPSNFVSRAIFSFKKVIKHINLIESRAALELVMQRYINYNNIPDSFWYGKSGTGYGSPAYAGNGWGMMLPDALNYDNTYYFATDKSYKYAEEWVTVWLRSLVKWSGGSPPSSDDPDLKRHYNYAIEVLKAILKSRGKQIKPRLFVPGFGTIAPDSYDDLPDEYKHVIQIALYIIPGPIGKILSFLIAFDRAKNEYDKGQYANAGSILVEQVAFAAIDGVFSLARALPITKRLTKSNRLRILNYSKGGSGIVLNALEKKALNEIMKVVTQQEITTFTKQKLALEIIKAIRIAGSKWPAARRLQVAVAEKMISFTYFIKTAIALAIELKLWNIADQKGQYYWNLLYKELGLGERAIKKIDQVILDNHTDENGDFITPNEFVDPDPDKFKL